MSEIVACPTCGTKCRVIDVHGVSVTDGKAQSLTHTIYEPLALTALERAVVEEVRKLIELDDAFEGLDKEEDYFGGLADRRNQKIDEIIELARPLLVARASQEAVT